MSIDSGSPIAPRPPTSATLPRIRSLRIRRISFEAPKHEHFTSPLSRYHGQEVIEFTVETDGAVPTRAYGPALFVGAVEVSHSERTGQTTWRFLQFEPEKLKLGAPISWGWMKDPRKNRQRTEFRYQLESAPDIA